MKKHKTGMFLRHLTWFLLVGLCVVNFGGASILMPVPEQNRASMALDINATRTLQDLKRFGILGLSSQTVIQELLAYQRATGKSLAEILSNPWWSRRLGLGSQQYLATWYMSNPFELLPSDLQEAIRQTPIPFKTRDGINAWCDEMGAPESWRAALKSALIETTPFNLWRASRGERPYARNGEMLEPIVIEHGAGRFEVREGHIAVDPRFIPINSEVLLLVRIQGEEHVLKVKAADTGSAIKGHHVDLPIYLHPNKEPLPRTAFPKEHIRNPYVRILMPIPAVSREPRVSRDRKA